MLNAIEKFLARATCFVFGHKSGSIECDGVSSWTCDRCQTPGMPTLIDWVNKLLDLLPF
jgi:hypothetical protein